MSKFTLFARTGRQLKVLTSVAKLAGPSLFAGTLAINWIAVRSVLAHASHQTLRSKAPLGTCCTHTHTHTHNPPMFIASDICSPKHPWDTLCKTMIQLPQTFGLKRKQHTPEERKKRKKENTQINAYTSLIKLWYTHILVHT